MECTYVHTRFEVKMGAVHRVQYQYDSTFVNEVIDETYHMYCICSMYVCMYVYTEQECSYQYRQSTKD